ncbi:hypothetical protein T484DRAFT_1765372 [Baffinella frigidus]|nr:hypothetical protein T484DRAFT_1765372 [Cryptophyta sp. CCMP2293]
MGQGMSCGADVLACSSDKPDIDHVRLSLLGKDGQRFGAGINFRVGKDGSLIVASCAPGGASQRAGVQAGDVLQSIDEEDVIGLTVEQIYPKILGPQGSNLTVKFQRGDGDLGFAPRAVTFIIRREPLPTFTAPKPAFAVVPP